MPWPGGHSARRFRGASAFEALATDLLAAGHARHERLLLVADEPNEAQWPEGLRSGGDLQVSSVAEVYGPQRLADPPALLAGFRERLADALRDGYTGLRVVADNSAMLDGPERAEAWRRWEPVADMFMAAYPVTGVCAFDDERVDPETLSAVLALHHPTDS